MLAQNFAHNFFIKLQHVKCQFHKKQSLASIKLSKLTHSKKISFLVYLESIFFKSYPFANSKPLKALKKLFQD